MTPKLIRSVAAACLAAAILPAQEEHEVIVRVKADEAKATAKKSGASDKKMVALLEKLADSELSKADRLKVAEMLKKMLGDGKSGVHSITIDGTSGIDVIAEKSSKPKGLRWHVAQGKDAKKVDLPKGVEWVTLVEEHNKAKGAKSKANTWVEHVEEVHEHKKHEHGAHGEHGEEHKKKGEHVSDFWVRATKGHPDVARVITTKDGHTRTALIKELNKSISHGHGAGGGIGYVNVEQGKGTSPRAIARLSNPGSEFDAVAIVKDVAGDGADTLRWVSSKAQGQGKGKSKKGGDLGTRAKQLRARLLKPDTEEIAVEYVFDEAQGPSKSSRLSEAKKAYAEAKKAYEAAKKAHGKAGTAKQMFGTVVLDDVTEAKVEDGTITYFLNRTGKQDPKKAKAKAHATGEVQYLIKKGNETFEFKPGAEVFEFKPDGKDEDVRIFLRGADGKVKTVKPGKKASGKGKGDGFTFEWTADADVDVFMDSSKGKSKKGKTDKSGGFVFDTWTSKKGDKGNHDGLLKLLKSGDGAKAHGLWVVGDGEEGTHGAWVTEVPGVEKDVLLKLLSKNGKKHTEHGTILKLLGGAGKDAEAGHDSLLKLLGNVHEHAGDVEVVVESEECPALTEECEECEEICEECEEEEGGNAEVLEMIQEMRAEMRELRDMMQQIRSSLRSKNVSRGTAERVRTGRLLPAVRKEDVTELRVRRRETR